MTLHAIAIDLLLGLTVLSCWIGVIGMLRMRNPYEALHFLAVPATIGVSSLTVAVFVEAGFGSTFLKVSLIAGVIMAINSVVAHATARAFRTREVGHWEPLDGDALEWVPSTHHPEEPKP